MRFRQRIGRVRAGENLKLVDAALASEDTGVLVAEERLNAEPDILVRH